MPSLRRASSQSVSSQGVRAFKEWVWDITLSLILTTILWGLVRVFGIWGAINIVLQLLGGDN
jgi:hypothetical protein